MYNQAKSIYTRAAFRRFPDQERSGGMRLWICWIIIFFNKICMQVHGKQKALYTRTVLYIPLVQLMCKSRLLPISLIGNALSLQVQAKFFAWDCFKKLRGGKSFIYKSCLLCILHTAQMCESHKKLYFKEMSCMGSSHP